jgi:hypothetical protein
MGRVGVDCSPNIPPLVQVTLQINEEVHEQNKALEQMQSGMGAGDDLMTSALKKMGVNFPVLTNPPSPLLFALIFSLLVWWPNSTKP